MSIRAVRRLSYLAVARVPGTRAHSIQIAKTCEALARRLDEVELVLPRFIGGSGDSPVPQGVRLVRVVAPDFLPLARWVAQWLMRLLFDVQSAAFALVALMRAVFRHRFDVYYTRSPFVALAFALAFGRRTVLELHVPPRSAARVGLLRLGWRLGSRLVTISNALRDDVARVLRVPVDEIGIAHDGFDPSLFETAPDRVAVRRRYGLAESACVFCYVGSAATLGAGKGVQLLVETFCAGRLDNAALVLLGVTEGATPSRAPGVQYRARVPPGEVAALLRACDAALMSFPDDAVYARAMSPLKLFEYMAAALPIIAPDLPNLREVLDESCALFVPPGDKVALSDAMRRLGAQPDLRARLGQRAAERAGAYTWDARAERLVAFLSARGR